MHILHSPEHLLAEESHICRLHKILVSGDVLDDLRHVLVCFIHKVALLQLLRNAQRSIRQVFRDEKRIAGSRLDCDSTK